MADENNIGMTTPEIELSINESLRLVEALVKFLNKKNNETQHIIRSNKDKDNQKIIDIVQRMFNGEPDVDTVIDVQSHSETEIKHRIDTAKWVFDTIYKKTGINLKNYKP